MWFHLKDETTGFNNNIANTDDFKSFNYKTKLLDNKASQPAPNDANGIKKNTTIAIPLKNLNNFWRSLEMALINCKVKCKLEWTKFGFCLQLGLIIQLLVLIKLFSLRKTLN